MRGVQTPSQDYFFNQTNKTQYYTNGCKVTLVFLVYGSSRK